MLPDTLRNMDLKKILPHSFLLLSTVALHAQPGILKMTPVQSLDMDSVQVEVPAKFKSKMSGTYKVFLPKKFKARIFYVGGLNKPRFMSFDDHGTLLVADDNSSALGNIYAMPDKDGDGVADTAIKISSGYTYNHDVKYYKNAMYVTEWNKVWKCTDDDSDGIYENKNIFIDSIAYGIPIGNHVTRTLVFDSINHKAYLSIGSRSNVGRETERAIIRQYNEDGSGSRIFATGIRNAVGLALHPKTNRLWANNNGSDNQGNEVPPEWIDMVRDQGFYGHPFAYGNQVWFNFDTADYIGLKPITATDSSLVQSMVEPAALIRAHQAPMGLMFLNDKFPAFQKGFLCAVHGSWNTTAPNAYRGYKVIYGDLSNDADTTVNYVADFCSGFLTDSINRVFWARPVGLVLDKTGNLFISSDEGNKFIMEVYPDKTGMKEIHGKTEWKIYPNPVDDELIIEIELRRPSSLAAGIFDPEGREILTWKVQIQEFPATSQEIKLNTSSLKPGIYFCRIQCGEEILFSKFIRQ